MVHVTELGWLRNWFPDASALGGASHRTNAELTHAPSPTSTATRPFEPEPKAHDNAPPADARTSKSRLRLTYFDGPSARPNWDFYWSRRRRFRSLRHHHLPPDAPGDGVPSPRTPFKILTIVGCAGTLIFLWLSDDGELPARPMAAAYKRGPSQDATRHRGARRARRRRCPTIVRQRPTRRPRRTSRRSGRIPAHRLRGGERDGNERGSPKPPDLLIDNVNRRRRRAGRTGSVAGRRRRLGRRVGERGRAGFRPRFRIREASGERCEGTIG